MFAVMKLSDLKFHFPKKMESRYPFKGQGSASSFKKSLISECLAYMAKFYEKHTLKTLENVSHTKNMFSDDLQSNIIINQASKIMKYHIK